MNSVILGERIAQKRKAKGYTQTQLAQLLSVSNKTISRWETGEGYPEISVLAPMSKLLDTTVDELLSDREADSPEKNKRHKEADNSLIAVLIAIFIYKAASAAVHYLSNQYIEKYSYLAGSDEFIGKAIVISNIIKVLLLVTVSVFLIIRCRKTTSFETKSVSCSWICSYFAAEMCSMFLKMLYMKDINLRQGQIEDVLDVVGTPYVYGQIAVAVCGILIFTAGVTMALRSKKITVLAIITVMIMAQCMLMLVSDFASMRIINICTVILKNIDGGFVLVTVLIKFKRDVPMEGEEK